MDLSEEEKAGNDAEGEKMIENAKIKNVELSMEDHGCLTLWLTLEGKGWGCGFGGRCLGKGHLGAKEFTGLEKGTEEIMRIMDVVGVSRFTDMKGKYIRVDFEGVGTTIEKIGNIIEDKWFDYREFYSQKE